MYISIYKYIYTVCIYKYIYWGERGKGSININIYLYIHTYWGEREKRKAF